MSRILITGTSTGIGLAATLELAGRGHTVVATMRDRARSAGLRQAAKAASLDVDIRTLDVTDSDSVDACIASVLAEGPLDVLVNNAGVAGAAPLELVDDDRHRAMFEANYFGPMRAIRAVLPSMRKRRSGTIVNVSSVAGRIAIPNQVPYSASKWALECASEALAHEVRRFGIRIRLIEPGVIMTKIFENAAAHTVYDKRSPYIDLMRRNGKFYAAGARAGVGPEVVAEAIAEAATSDSERLRYLVGDDAESWVAGRERLSDEAWIAMGDEMSDEAYAELFERRFGIRLA